MTEKLLDKVVVTAGPAAPPQGKILETPPGDRDLEVVVMTWLTQVFIRTLRTYLQAFVGFLLGGVTGVTNVVVSNVTDATGTELRVPVGDALDLVMFAASLAVLPAFVTFVHNAIEFLTKLDSPEWRA